MHPLVVKAPKRPSTYRGVYWSNGRSEAQIKVNGHQQYLGTYDTEEEAARAYDEKAKQLRDKPILNFLPDGSPNPYRKKNIGDQSVLFREQLEGTHRGDINQVEEDAVTVGVEGEDGEQTEGESWRQRPQKRGRWGQQQECDEVTVGIKTEEE